MMWDYGYGAWWMWIPGLLFTLLVLAGIAVLIVLLVRWTESSRAGIGTTSPDLRHEDSARRILEERLARGEITSVEFRELITTLNDTRPK